MIGWNQEELIGKSLHSIIHHTKEDGLPCSQEECLIYAAIKDGKVYRGETEMFWRKDGTKFPVEYSSNPIREAGQVVGTVVVYRDITSRKQVENAVRQNEIRYRSLLNQSPDPIFVSRTKDFRFVEVNDRACENYGYSREEFLKMNIFDVQIEASLREQVRDFYNETEVGRVVEIEGINKRKDGSTFPVHVRFTKLDDQNAVATVRDITEHKLVERARFQTIFESSPDGVVVSDMEGRIELINAQTEKLFGYKRDELIGKNVECMIPDRFRGKHVKHRAKYNINPTTRVLQGRKLTALRKDGSVFPVEINLSALQTEKGFCVISTVRDMTERNQTLEALNISEKRFRTLSRLSPVGIFQTDVAGDYLYVNKRWCELAGLTLEEAQGEGWARAVHPEDRERVFSEWFWSTKENRPFKSEYRFCHQNGTIKWVLGQSTPQVDDNGAIVGYVGTVTDITQGKNQEQSLRSIMRGTSTVTGVAFFRSLVQHLAEAIKVRWAFLSEIPDLKQGRIRLLSFWEGDRLGENFEYDWKGTPCENVINNGRCYFPKNVQALFPEDTWLAKNGAEAYFAIPLVDSSGTPLGHLGIMHDKEIIEDKSIDMILRIFAARAVAELERNKIDQERIKSLSTLLATLESTADGILVVDEQGKIAEFNQKFVDMWRLPKEILDTRDDDRSLSFVLDQLKHPEEFLQKVKVLYTQPEAESFDVLELKDGRVYERYSTSQKIAGKTIGRVWSFRDVTKQRKLQEIILRNEHLSELGELVSGVSHEVKNPLFSITATIDAFEARFGQKKEFEQYIKIFRQESQRLTGLMKDLLDYGKPSQLEPSWCSVSEVIRKSMEFCQELVTKRRVTLFCDEKERVPKLLIDFGRMCQVFQNLLENAVLYSPPGSSVRCEVCKVEVSGQDWIQCDIQDSGKGFQEEDLAKVFEPFFTKRSGGTGLGLSIVHRIVEEHGGMVWAENRSIGGGSVKVLLPVNRLRSAKESGKNSKP